jgi:hypothetical protein
MEISGFLVLIIGAVALISHGIGYQRGRIDSWKKCLREMENLEKKLNRPKLYDPFDVRGSNDTNVHRIETNPQNTNRNNRWGA